MAGTAFTPVCARLFFGGSVVLTLGEGTVVDSEGEGTVVGGVVTEGVGGVVFNCPQVPPSNSLDSNSPFGRFPVNYCSVLEAGANGCRTRNLEFCVVLEQVVGIAIRVRERSNKPSAVSVIVKVPPLMEPPTHTSSLGCWW